MAEPIKADNDFVEKLWSREPQWRLAAAFMPVSRREQWFDYLALQNEWLLAQALTDEAPRVAKLTWWAEELRGWSRGMRRHPLGTRLQQASGAWSQVADALLAGPQMLDALAHALQAVDGDLLGVATPVKDLQQSLNVAMAQIQGLDHGLEKSRNLPRLRALQAAVQQCNARKTAPSAWRTVLICWQAARKSR